MTSQGRMCVQCVTNGLQRRKTWPNTERFTLEKSGIHALSVRNVFDLGETSVITRICTRINTSAPNAADVVLVTETWQYTDEVIHERNCSNAVIAANDLRG